MNKTKKKIYNLILLDESGSMSSDKATVISNFNELIDDIKLQAKENKDIKQYISLITFNSMGIQVVLDFLKVKYFQLPLSLSFLCISFGHPMTP